MAEDKKEKSRLIMFEEAKVRRTWHNEEWFFSVVDVVAVLTESINPTDYLKKLRKRDLELGTYVGTNCPMVEMLTKSGKKRKTLAGNTKNILRIIQSMPSKKAEPFKQWLAKVGYDRIQEIENPELAKNRIRDTYKAKGYSNSWIEKRLQSIESRDELTSEWYKRGVKKGKEFAILTAEISKATFDMTPKEHKDFKYFPKRSKENLRDHMSKLELAFNTLAETATAEFTQERDSKKFFALKKDAKDGGDIAGNARKNMELKLGKRIITRRKTFKKKKEESPQIN